VIPQRTAYLTLVREHGWPEGEAFHALQGLAADQHVAHVTADVVVFLRPATRALTTYTRRDRAGTMAAARAAGDAIAAAQSSAPAQAVGT
jgi:hypothetical protein